MDINEKFRIASRYKFYDKWLIPCREELGIIIYDEKGTKTVAYNRIEEVIYLLQGDRQCDIVEDVVVEPKQLDLF